MVREMQRDEDRQWRYENNPLNDPFVGLDGEEIESVLTDDDDEEEDEMDSELDGLDLDLDLDSDYRDHPAVEDPEMVLAQAAARVAARGGSGGSGSGNGGGGGGSGGLGLDKPSVMVWNELANRVRDVKTPERGRGLSPVARESLERDVPRARARNVGRARSREVESEWEEYDPETFGLTIAERKELEDIKRTEVMTMQRPRKRSCDEIEEMVLPSGGDSPESPSKRSRTEPKAPTPKAPTPRVMAAPRIAVGQRLSFAEIQGLAGNSSSSASPTPTATMPQPHLQPPPRGVTEVVVEEHAPTAASSTSDSTLSSRSASSGSGFASGSEPHTPGSEGDVDSMPTSPSDYADEVNSAAKRVAKKRSSEELEDDDEVKIENGVRKKVKLTVMAPP